ncbi:alpha/beta hydrolase [Spirillospora sp. NPDC047279]|uniref:alpha/beta fold hydrolase n=1 Tax=Spirillospora sp. NPDC047279 TaxID=3155478 RepID=UPI0033E27575
MKISVPGAELYYEVRGTGPLLLISQSGEGDAHRTDALVGRLVDSFTVVTYDRRGLSRSTVTSPAPVTIATHAADVRHLLLTLTDSPVAMLGCSMGAAIGLHLAAAHDRLHTLIAHEPVAPYLLPAPERARHVQELAGIQEVFHRHGWRAALAPMAETLGIDPRNQDVEPGIVLPPMTEERAGNFARFIAHDFTAVREDALDTGPLRTSPTRIVPAVGATTPHEVFDRRCAEVLANLRGVGIEEFPGGHNGSMTHPSGYAGRLRELLGA